MNNLYHRLSHIPPQGFILLMNITFGFPLTKNSKIRVKIQYSTKFQITCFKKRLNGCYFNESEHASKLEHEHSIFYKISNYMLQKKIERLLLQKEKQKKLDKQGLP
jgi:hypothetical protein